MPSYNFLTRIFLSFALGLHITFAAFPVRPVTASEGRLFDLHGEKTWLETVRSTGHGLGIKVYSRDENRHRYFVIASSMIIDIASDYDFIIDEIPILQITDFDRQESAVFVSKFHFPKSTQYHLDHIHTRSTDKEFPVLVAIVRIIYQELKSLVKPRAKAEATLLSSRQAEIEEKLQELITLTETSYSTNQGRIASINAEIERHPDKQLQLRGRRTRIQAEIDEARSNLDRARQEAQTALENIQSKKEVLSRIRSAQSEIAGMKAPALFFHHIIRQIEQSDPNAALSLPANLLNKIPQK